MENELYKFICDRDSTIIDHIDRYCFANNREKKDIIRILYNFLEGIKKRLDDKYINEASGIIDYNTIMKYLSTDISELKKIKLKTTNSPLDNFLISDLYLGADAAIPISYVNHLGQIVNYDYSRLYFIMDYTIIEYLYFDSPLISNSAQSKREQLKTQPPPNPKALEGKYKFIKGKPNYLESYLDEISNYFNDIKKLPKKDVAAIVLIIYEKQLFDKCNTYKSVLLCCCEYWGCIPPSDHKPSKYRILKDEYIRKYIIFNNNPLKDTY